jgi:general secretion pathway protein A
MYKDFFGLRELPFDLTPNPKYLFLTASHREALSNLQYGLSSAKALTVLVGEAGTGKTTLVGAAVAADRCRHVRCVCVNNPTLTRNEFMETLARSFELSPAAAQSKTTVLVELERILRDRHARGEVTAKLLVLVLAGQPELAARLEHTTLRQLKQRIALRCELAPFELSDTAAYIASRIRTAGGVVSRIFTREAVEAIHQSSGGIPRTINVMCDNALVTGFAIGRQPVDRAIALEVAKDFCLQAPSDSVAPAVRTPSEINGGAVTGGKRAGLNAGWVLDRIPLARRFASSSVDATDRRDVRLSHEPNR